MAAPRSGRIVSVSQDAGSREWLETDGFFAAMIDVAEHGYARSSLTAVFVCQDPCDGASSLSLHADLHARAHLGAAPTFLPSKRRRRPPVDYGCATPGVDDAGKSPACTHRGLGGLELGGLSRWFQTGHTGNETGFWAGTPYFEGTSGSFRTALSRLDFDDGDAGALNSSLLRRRSVTHSLSGTCSRASAVWNESESIIGCGLASPPNGVNVTA